MSVDSTPSTSEMAAASTFSYAQAAKGQQGTIPQTSESTPVSKAESSTSAAPTEKSVDTQASTAETSQAASTIETRPTAPEKQEVESVSAVDSESRADSAQGKRSETKRDDETSRLDRPWRRNDKSTRSSSAATRSVDEQDSKRPRKGKKSRNADKQTNGDNTNAEGQKDEPEAPKIELADAAIPSVNIWQQRKEAQGAKPKSEPIVNGTSDTTSSHTQAASTAASFAPMNGAKPTPKMNDKPERNASRGNRVATREAKAELLPPTNDAISWPTPETAVHEEKKPAEKPIERPTQEEGAAKPRHKKEWQAYNFVPTVSFETQLPQMRNSKPRGGAKGSSGARTASGAQSVEKSATSTPSKSTEARERTPRETPNGAPRNNSLPPTSKRTSMDVANVRGEQKRSVPNNGAEKSRDSASNHQLEQQQQQQPSRDGRSDRGRGGFRGRGGHHAMTSHPHQHNGSSMGAPSYPPNGALPTRSQGPYSPPPRGGHSQMYMAPPQRGRGARNGGYNSHRMSLPNGGSSRLPALQTQPGPYDYQMQGPMTAAPYQQPYWDPSGMLAVLRHQIEYYFSIENLCKDVFLRQHMDSQGFVPLMFVVGFHRMKTLQPDMSHVRMVCEESDVVDFVMAEDDSTERLRRRDGWERFVMPMPDRDQLAQNDGPARLIYKSRSYNYPQFNSLMASPYGVASPPPYAGQVSYSDPTQGMNGMVNGHGPTQLSANVPDFSPSQAPGESPQLPNGHDSGPVVNGVNGDHASDAGQS